MTDSTPVPVSAQTMNDACDILRQYASEREDVREGANDVFEADYAARIIAAVRDDLVAEAWPETVESKGGGVFYMPPVSDIAEAWELVADAAVDELDEAATFTDYVRVGLERSVAEALAPIRAALERSFAQSAVSADPHAAHREAVDYVRQAILAVMPASVPGATS